MISIKVDRMDYSQDMLGGGSLQEETRGVSMVQEGYSIYGSPRIYGTPNSNSNLSLKVHPLVGDNISPSDRGT